MGTKKIGKHVKADMRSGMLIAPFPAHVKAFALAPLKQNRAEKSQAEKSIDAVGGVIMRLRFFSISLGVFLSVLLVAAYPALSRGSPSRSDPIVSAKGLDIYRYHFKKNAYGCEVCHGNAQDDGYKVRTMESDACYQCHARVDDAPWTHGPVAVGQCSVCHEPHGSKNAKFLLRKNPAIEDPRRLFVEKVFVGVEPLDRLRCRLTDTAVASAKGGHRASRGCQIGRASCRERV